MCKSSWYCEGEAELVRRARHGDLVAFDVLVAHYRPGAVLLARQILRTREEAEDAVQDSFLAAFKALPQLSDTNSFPYWFGAIVRHRSRRMAMGERRSHLPLDNLILTHAPSIWIEIESRTQDEVIRRSIANLPNEVNAAMQLHYLEDWSVFEIASFLGLPYTTVKWRLHTGRKLMRKALSNEMEETNEPA